MVRETSRVAYNEIKENGLLSERRFQVYDALTSAGPCTGVELSKVMGYSDTTQGNVRARLGELRDLGVATEDGTTFCTVTGRRAIKWVTTNSLPVDVKRKSKFDRLLEKERKLKNDLIKVGLAKARLLDTDFKKRQVKLF